MNFWNILITKVSSIFKDGTDDMWSSVRVVFIFTIVLSNLVLWGIWGGISIAKHQLQRIPQSVIVLYTSANGVTATTKIWQKKIEKK